MNTFTVTHYFALAGVAMAPLLMVVSKQQMTLQAVSDPKIWIEVFLTGLFGFIGQVCLNKGMQIERAGPASAMRFLDVVFVFVWELSFLHGSVSPWSVMGACLICVCTLLIAAKSARRSVANVQRAIPQPKTRA